jgi:Tat protein secretion system quality control protein TatD with DNase activity
MYLSFWFDFILRPESTPLIKSLPREKIFLETDGADVSIGTIYKKVASDLDMSADELKTIIHANFNELFK